jgi:hypothetical protein
MIHSSTTQPEINMANNFSPVIENPVAYHNAVKRNIIANANKTWYAKTERASEIDEALNAGRTHSDYGSTSGYVDGFMGSMAEAYDKYGKLSEKQCAAILKGIDAKIARKAEWADKEAALNASRTHLGEVGEKITFILTCVHVVEIDGMYGTTYINICEDADKNVVIYKGNAKGFPEKGETATITATVKDHGVRNGVKQTVIQRPKAVKELVAA